MAWSVRPDPHIVTPRLGLIVLALTSALYLVALDRAPSVIGGDETHFAIHAESIARTGRDLNGQRLPLFVRISDPMVPNNSTNIWYQPLLFYAMTPFIALMGVNEWSARIPVALAAVANLWLMYAIGLRLFRDARYAVAGAIMLALTPAHVIVARQALDYIAPLPFVLGWLLCLVGYVDTGRVRTLVLGGFLLGAGVFSYIAAWILMPCYFALTAIVVWRTTRGSRVRDISLFAAGFAVPIAALIAAFVLTPAMLASTLARYNVGGTDAPSPGIFERVTLYWDYFNPSFLFFAGGSNPTQATGRVGVFLLALGPLALAGIREAITRRSDLWLMTLVAVALSPLPIAITMPPAASYSIGRAMTLLPFVVLLATLGAQSLMSDRRLRVAGAACLIALPLQFALFAGDYRGEYMLRAGPRLDPVNMRVVADTVIAHDRVEPVSRIYFNQDLDDGGARWRFFMLKARRMDLWERSRQINLASAPTIESGAMIVSYAGDRDALRLIDGGYRVVARVDGVAGTPAALILKAPG